MAIDIKTGAKKWSQAFETDIKSSCVGENGIIYFADSGSSVYALESIAK